MPIKWSAVKVSEAMDGVESQIGLAAIFFAEAKARAEEALKIPDLPQYIEQRIQTLIWDIQRINQVKDKIEGVRKYIPDGAIEEEQGRTRHGGTQPLI